VADAAARVVAEPLPAGGLRRARIDRQRVRAVAAPAEQRLEVGRPPVQVSDPVQPVEVVNGLGDLAARHVADVGERALVHVERRRPPGHGLLHFRREGVAEDLDDGHELDQLVALGLGAQDARDVGRRQRRQRLEVEVLAQQAVEQRVEQAWLDGRGPPVDPAGADHRAGDHLGVVGRRVDQEHS
jgi:hypothetical protein